ncbi:chemotaxis protein CheW [Sedimenticola sp.]|uniref:chemotaxis protein CheW n=1 Tax=Sedimenticola sp. TaxID=1940285 RepID=UPI003D0FAD25
MNLPVNSKPPLKVDAAEAQTEEDQYLTFTLQQEMFAIGILNIKEILEYGQLTTVPLMPDFIRGVINLRGAVVPVIDLGARFGGCQSEITKRTCIVIIEVACDGEHQDLGVVVDTVSEVLEIPENNIQPAPTFGTHIRADFIEKMGKVNGKFVIILDVNKVLSVEEMASVSQIAEASVD